MSDSKSKTPETTSDESLVVPDRLPRHIAIIMDGNGRWAQRLGLPRIEGHRQGAETVRRITERCGELGIEQLTLYCLSSENWKRPASELEFLMALLSQYLRQERDHLLKNHVRLQTIGRVDQLSAQVQLEISESIAATADQTGICLCLAINYGGRAEIADAVRDIATKARAGQIDPKDIDEQMISQHLYTAKMPDPDLLIRTAGEMRISNYLLWQISYSELWVTPKTWPEFEEDDLHAALAEYSKRDRRYGGLSKPEVNPC